MRMEAHRGKPADPASHNGRLVPALVAWSLFYVMTIAGAVLASHSPEKLATPSAATIAEAQIQ